MDFDIPGAVSAGSKADRTAESDPGYVPGIVYDGYGRYKLPRPGVNPDTLIPYTRVTTIAGALMNSEGLRIWSERKIVEGLGMMPALRAQIGADPHDKATQDEVIEIAKTVAGVHEPARYGSAFHKAFETWAKNPDAYEFQPETEADMRASIMKLTEQSITVKRTELCVVNATMEYAGRLDGIWVTTLPDGRAVWRIGDEKTGKDMTSPSKRTQCGIQLAGYAHCTHVYDPATRTFTPLVGIDQEVGYILAAHDGVCELFEIDLIAGWEGFKTAWTAHQQSRAANAVRFIPLGNPARWEPPQAQEETTWQPSTAQPNTASIPQASMKTTEWAAPINPSSPQAVTATLALAPEPATTSVASTTVPAVATQSPLTTVTDAEPPSAPAAAPELNSAGEEKVKGKRRCGNCRQLGHTTRTCKNPPAGSQPPASEAPAATEQATTAAVGSLADGDYCTCGSPDGWTKVVDSPEIWACGRCGKPSKEATERVAAIRAQEQQFQARIPQMAAQAAGGVAPSPVTPAQQLLSDIAVATSHEALRGLWQQFGSIWQAEHTAAAEARAAQLPPG